MMITVNRQGKDLEYITGSYDGKQFSVNYDETKYRLMMDLVDRASEAPDVASLRTIIAEFEPLTKESYKELVETACPFIVVNKHQNKFYLKYADKVSRFPLPKVLADKIIKSIEKDVSPLPLIKCWVRYLRQVPGRPAFNEKEAALFAQYIDADYVNDDYKAELETHGIASEVAKDKATTKQLAITLEGLLVCYKVSNEITKKYIKDPEAVGGVKQVEAFDYDVDEITGQRTFKTPDVAEDRVFEPPVMGQGGDAFLCGDKLGHIIKVGQVIKLDSWDKVSKPGCKGLHVGGLRYIKGYQKEGTVTHNVFVDPMDIHSVGGLGYGSDGALTCIRYFPHSTFGAVNKQLYHSSTYAAMTDQEWASIIEQVVEETAAKKEDMDALVGEQRALSNASKATKDGTMPQSTGSVFGSFKNEQ